MEQESAYESNVGENHNGAKQPPRKRDPPSNVPQSDVSAWPTPKRDANDVQLPVSETVEYSNVKSNAKSAAPAASATSEPVSDVPEPMSKKSMVASDVTHQKPKVVDSSFSTAFKQPKVEPVDSSFSTAFKK